MSWVDWVLCGAAAFAVILAGERWALSKLRRTYSEPGGRVLRTQFVWYGELGPLHCPMTLSAREGGLGISVWLGGSVVVPWHEIRREHEGGPIGTMTVLLLGEPELGRLGTPSRVWEVLAAYRPERGG